MIFSLWNVRELNCKDGNNKQLERLFIYMNYLENQFFSFVRRDSGRRELKKRNFNMILSNRKNKRTIVV